MAPRVAVTMAAILNFVGAFLSLQVAATIAERIVDADLITPTIVFAGLVGAIFWNLLTWYFGLPSSSSHALIGGLVGAAFVAEGADGVLGDGLVEKVVVPALVAPVLAFVVAGLAILIAYRIVGRQRAGNGRRGFRLGQMVSGGLFSLSHGTNDAQKTMGIIVLALVANGSLAPGDDVPTWVVLSAATAIALGTYVGGWRIIKTMGSKIIKMDPAQGFAAQGVGRGGDPVGVALRLPALDHPRHLRRDHGRRRGQARLRGALGRRGNIVIAWVLTLPAAARRRRAARIGVDAHLRRRRGRAAARPSRWSARSSWRSARRLSAGRTLTAEG